MNNNLIINIPDEYKQYIHGIYLTGSRVLNLDTDKSDYDMVCLLKDQGKGDEFNWEIEDSIIKNRILPRGYDIFFKYTNEKQIFLFYPYYNVKVYGEDHELFICKDSNKILNNKIAFNHLCKRIDSFIKYEYENHSKRYYLAYLFLMMYYNDNCEITPEMYDTAYKLKLNSNTPKQLYDDIIYKYDIVKKKYSHLLDN